MGNETRLYEIKTRLKQIYDAKKKELGLTQIKVAELLDIGTQGGVSHYMNPNSTQSISKEMIIKFASVLHVEPTEIDPNIAEEFATLVAKLQEHDKTKLSNSIRLNLLDNRLAAGDGVVNIEYPDTIRSIEFSPETFIEIFRRKNANNISIAIIEGSSMYNPEDENMSLKDGDIAVIDTSLNAFEDDGIYAFVFEGKARIKRLQYMSGYRLKVISDNPRYDYEILERDQVEQIHFIGKLIKKLRLDVVDL